MVAEASKALEEAKQAVHRCSIKQIGQRSVMETSTTKPGYHDYQKRSGEKLSIQF